MSNVTINNNLHESINKELNSINQTGKIIFDASLSIEDEAKKLDELCLHIFEIDLSLTEARVRFWRELGEMLMEHKSHVKISGHGWEKWAVTHFKFLKATRRDQCMSLAKYADSLELFYFLGIDRLYYFANLMVKFHGDPDIRPIAKRFNLDAGKNLINVNQDEYRKNIDKLYEYFKLKLKLNGVNCDKEFVLDVIDSGVKFSKVDYEVLIKLQSDPDKQSKFLLKMLLNGGTPKGNQTTGDNKDSTMLLMAKFIENIDSYKITGRIPADYTKQIVRQFFDSATWFYSNVPN